MLPVSLYCIRIESCAQCYRCLCIVFVLSLVPNVTSVSVLYSYWVLCPMLPVSLYCICIESGAQCYRCLCIVFVLSLVPNFTSVSVLYSYWVLCPMLPVSLYCICIESGGQCYRCLCIVFVLSLTNGQYRNTGNVGHKTQYEYNTETLVTLGTRLNTNTIQRHR
jgi:hypothetical protein